MHIREKSEKLFSALFNEAAFAPKDFKDNIYVEKARELLKQDGFEFQGTGQQGPFNIAVFEHNTSSEQLLILYANGLAMLDQDGQDIGYPLLMRESSKEVGYLADYIAEKIWGDQSRSTGPKMIPRIVAPGEGARYPNFGDTILNSKIIKLSDFLYPNPWLAMQVMAEILRNLDHQRIKYRAPGIPYSVTSQM